MGSLRYLSLGEHPDQLESKPQALFGIPVEFTSVDPPVDCAHVPDAANVGGQLAPDEANKLLHNLGDGELEIWNFHRCHELLYIAIFQSFVLSRILARDVGFTQNSAPFLAPVSTKVPTVVWGEPLR